MRHVESKRLGWFPRCGSSVRCCIKTVDSPIRSLCYYLATSIKRAKPALIRRMKRLVSRMEKSEVLGKAELKDRPSVNRQCT